MGADVRVITGVPTAANFALGNVVPCSPIVINDATAMPYVLIAGIVTPLTSSSSGVTSVAFSGGMTGLTVSGSPITTSGTITLSGTLGAANGGTGLTSLAAGIATFLGSANATDLRTAVNGTTGTAGNLVFSNSPTLVTPALGTPTALVLTNATGLPLASANFLVGSGGGIATGVAMSGDATLSNAGAVTLATVNANVGSFTAANITVNAKGLITAAASGSSSGAPWPTSTIAQLVTSNATVTIPAGAMRAYAEMIGSGAGGSGDTVATVTGQGGGAGAWAAQWFSGLTPGNTLAATVPAGGAGGASNNDGTDGSQASLASGTQTITTLSANGGTKGLVATTTPVAPQTTTAGALFSLPGQGVPSRTAVVGFYAIGGNSIWGYGGYPVVASAGNNGSGYGSGGGGGSVGSAGGNGAPALIKIWWFT